MALSAKKRNLLTRLGSFHSQKRKDLLPEPLAKIGAYERVGWTGVWKLFMIWAMIFQPVKPLACRPSGGEKASGSAKDTGGHTGKPTLSIAPDSIRSLFGSEEKW
jgi:hypothetical protein